MPIPRLIIQTHRDPAITPELRQSWIDLHPGYEYRFYTNAHCRKFFSEHLPELLPVYDKLPLPVQKADLFRYAAIYWHGGIYANVDTICRAPVDSYIHMDENPLVAGVEMSPAIYRHSIHDYVAHYSSPGQLLQWTFAASPRHPALARMLARIRFLVGLNTRELSGPMGFTQSLHDYLSLPHAQKVTLLPQLYHGSWKAKVPAPAQ